jgi:hypothetical protein
MEIRKSKSETGKSKSETGKSELEIRKSKFEKGENGGNHSPLPWGEGGPQPAFSSAGAGRVRG